MNRVRLALSLMVLLSAGALFASRAMRAAGEGETLRPLALPDRVGGWTAGREERFAPDVLALIEPDAYAMQLYHATDRSPVWVYVGVYGGRAGYGRGAHDPEICFPAQGWEIQRVAGAVVQQNGERIHGRRLVVRRMNEEEVVLYWFQPAGRWPREGLLEQVLQMLDAAAGRPQYAFVRLSAPRGAIGSSEAELHAFAAALAPSVRSMLERREF